MGFVLFSRYGVHHNDGIKGTVVAVFSPLREQMRHFTDIPSINQKSVRERYGEPTLMPLYRQEGDVVHVYGVLPKELAELRQGLEVFLPQDFVPENVNVFYFAFGRRWLVHGVKNISDDGVVDWGISRTDASEKNIVDVIVSSVSDRMFEGDKEEICIAVHDDKELLVELQQALEPLNLDAVRFDSMTRDKSVSPLYFHRDFGLMMLTAIMFAFLILIGSSAYLFTNTKKLDKLDQEIVQLKTEIKKIQTNKRLGHIKNPKQLLDFMSKPLKQQPSAILHAAGEVASVFGDLDELIFDISGNPSLSKGEVVVEAAVKGVRNDLLLDQERIANSVLSSRPWIRAIERPGKGGGQGGASLLIGIKVE